MLVKYVSGHWYLRLGNNWARARLVIACEGGGVRGVFRYWRGAILCMFGIHRYISTARFVRNDQNIPTGIKAYRICSYCRKGEDEQNQS